MSDDLYAAKLTIDLDVVAANYRLLQGKLDASGATAGAAAGADHECGGCGEPECAREGDDQELGILPLDLERNPPPHRG